MAVWFQKQGNGESARDLLHEQHLARALDRAVQPALIMRRKTGVFSRQDASLIGDKLPEQVDVLEIKSIHCEINFRLWPRGADFAISRTAMAAFFGFVGTSLSRHKVLLDFAMNGVATECWIVFLNLQLFGL